MPADHVANFVSKHACNLILMPEAFKQPISEKNLPPRQRERINRLLIRQQVKMPPILFKFRSPVAHGIGLHEFHPDGLHRIAQPGIAVFSTVLLDHFRRRPQTQGHIIFRISHDAHRGIGDRVGFLMRLRVIHHHRADRHQQRHAQTGIAQEHAQQPASRPTAALRHRSGLSRIIAALLRLSTTEHPSQNVSQPAIAARLTGIVFLLLPLRAAATLLIPGILLLLLLPSLPHATQDSSQQSTKPALRIIGFIGVALRTSAALLVTRVFVGILVGGISAHGPPT